MSKAKKIAIIIDASGNISGTNFSGSNTGFQNSAVGMNALYSNTTGNYNSVVGYDAAIDDWVEPAFIDTTLAFQEGITNV